MDILMELVGRTRPTVNGVRDVSFAAKVLAESFISCLVYPSCSQLAQFLLVKNSCLGRKSLIFMITENIARIGSTTRSRQNLSVSVVRSMQKRKVGIQSENSVQWWRHIT